MSIPLATDIFLLRRGSTNYKVPYSKLTTIADDDLMLVQRGDTQYKVTGAFVKAYLLDTPPIPNEPWTPADMATATWYDSTNLSTITATANAVSEWRDVKGNSSLAAAQGNGSQQPLLQPNGVLLGNGQSLLHNNAIFSSPNSVVTTFSVHEPVHPSDYMILFMIGGDVQAIGGDGSGRGHFVDSFNASPAPNPFACSGFGTATLNFPAYAGRPYSASCIIPSGPIPGDTRAPNQVGGEVTIRIAGISYDTNIYAGVRDTAHQAIREGLILGGWGIYSRSCRLQQVVFIEGAANAADLARLEGWAAHKHSFADLLPADHPYKNAPPLK